MAQAEKDTVLQAHAQNRAITSLLAAIPDSILDAAYYRDELTLTIAKDQIREAAAVVQTGRLQLSGRRDLRGLVSQRAALPRGLPHPFS